MKRAAWLGLIAIVLAGTASAKGPDVKVRVDPRVELLSIIFRLAGNPEYGKGRVPGYTAAVEKHFGKYRDHDAVTLARDLRARRGVSYDAVAGMAVHLADVPSLKPVVPLDPWPEALDRRWTAGDAKRFLEAAGRFRDESKFPAFFEARKLLYDLGVSRMKALLAKDAGFDWFTRFFGEKPAARFTLILGMLNGPMCYGPRVVRPDGTEELFCVLGVWQVDADGKPVFTKDMLGIVAHEFCHSFVNPLVDRHLDTFERAGKAIYPTVRDAMARQAYVNWETMVKESLVRACVVRYVLATRGAAAAKEEADAQLTLSFSWVPEFAVLLGEYEKDRGTFPTLSAFVPRMGALFERWAAKAAAAPRVVSMVPANGATDVDPARTEIRVTFDRPMKAGGWSFVGGGPTFPKTTGGAFYDGARKVITLPVALVPNHRYEFWLNRGRFQAFRSEKGVALPSVHVTFTTGEEDHD